MAGGHQVAMVNPDPTVRRPRVLSASGAIEDNAIHDALLAGADGGDQTCRPEHAGMLTGAG